jgi:hypothetical protein
MRRSGNHRGEASNTNLQAPEKHPPSQGFLPSRCFGATSRRDKPNTNKLLPPNSRRISTDLIRLEEI